MRSIHSGDDRAFLIGASLYCMCGGGYPMLEVDLCRPRCQRTSPQCWSTGSPLLSQLGTRGPSAKAEERDSYLWYRMQATAHMQEASSSLKTSPALTPMQNSGCEPRPVWRPKPIQKLAMMPENTVLGSVAKRTVGNGHAHMRTMAWMVSRLVTGLERRSHISRERWSTTVLKSRGSRL